MTWQSEHQRAATHHHINNRRKRKMYDKMNKRCSRREPLPSITIAIDTIPVRSHASTWAKPAWVNVPLTDIQIVRPSQDGLLDIVYTNRRRLPSGITVGETMSGESTIDQLLIALGWQAGMSHNEHLAKLTDFRFET